MALAHGSDVPAPTLPAVLVAWRFDALAIAGLLFAASAYLWAVRRVDRQHPGSRQPPYRSWLFCAGLTVIGVALLSPIEAYEGSLFSVHMVQHMLLELVAPPLLLAGAPITLALRTLSGGPRRSLVP